MHNISLFILSFLFIYLFIYLNQEFKNYGNSSKVHNMLRHQYVDLFEVRDAKWKKEEKNMNVSALFLFLPL